MHGCLEVYRRAIHVVAEWLQGACSAVTHLARLPISNDGETSGSAYAYTVAKALQLGAWLDDHHAATLRR